MTPALSYYWEGESSARLKLRMVRGVTFWGLFFQWMSRSTR